MKRSGLNGGMNHIKEMRDKDGRRKRWEIKGKVA
jgi:hypothetical protein